MIEYIYDAIRASAGNDITIAAQITEDTGDCVTEGCVLVLHIGDEMREYEGLVNDDMWEFTIPAKDTKGLNGRHWYCLKRNGLMLCFKQPIYFV